MMTTTGFASADFNLWPSLTALVLIGLVLVGASAGSTSGSIKLVRHIAIAGLLRREIDHTVHPEVVAHVRVNGAVVDERALRAMIVFVFLYPGVCAAGAVVILVDSTVRDTEPTAFQSIAAAATTCSRARAPAWASPARWAPSSRSATSRTLVLTALMYLGRLEIIPILVLLTRSHWRVTASSVALGLLRHEPQHGERPRAPARPSRGCSCQRLACRRCRGCVSQSAPP